MGVMKIRISRLRKLIREASRIILEAPCTSCGDPNAYVGFNSCECPNPNCEHFSQKQADDVKPKRAKTSSSEQRFKLDFAPGAPNTDIADELEIEYYFDPDDDGGGFDLFGTKDQLKKYLEKDGSDNEHITYSLSRVEPMSDEEWGEFCSNGGMPVKESVELVIRNSVRKILAEAPCTSCGDPNAYVGFNSCECPNPSCSHFSQRQADDVKPPNALVIDDHLEGMVCPECGGSGEEGQGPCDTCHGSGELSACPDCGCELDMEEHATGCSYASFECTECGQELNPDFGQGYTVGHVPGCSKDVQTP